MRARAEKAVRCFELEEPPASALIQTIGAEAALDGSSAEEIVGATAANLASVVRNHALRPAKLGRPARRSAAVAVVPIRAPTLRRPRTIRQRQPGRVVGQHALGAPFHSGCTRVGAGNNAHGMPWFLGHRKRSRLAPHVKVMLIEGPLGTNRRTPRTVVGLRRRPLAGAWESQRAPCSMYRTGRPCAARVTDSACTEPAGSCAPAPKASCVRTFTKASRHARSVWSSASPPCTRRPWRTPACSLQRH